MSHVSKSIEIRSEINDKQGSATSFNNVAALELDMGKFNLAQQNAENGFLLAELNDVLKNLEKWMEPESVATNLLNMPSSSQVLREPLGVVLVIGPWNYPFQLLITPLAGAMAAGNCIVIKSSEFAPATSAVMKQMIEENFDKNYIQFVEGDGAAVIPQMMNNFTFDHVFYTGSTAVGKIIYKMAAERLVPVTLELGGKSPIFVLGEAPEMSLERALDDHLLMEQIYAGLG